MLREVSWLGLGLALAMVSPGIVLAGDKNAEEEVPPALNFKMKSIAGKEVDLSQYKGKVVLMVNVASKCGLTPQYKELQALHEKFAKEGLAILGFPCNQFGKQEPGTESEIVEFCQSNYGVKFDLFSKIDVNGDKQAPLYKYLTSGEAGEEFKGPISWNFEKFVVGRDGRVVARFSPRTKPDDPEVLKVLERELHKAAPSGAR